jgi:hypothetical protein
MGRPKIFRKGKKILSRMVRGWKGTKGDGLGEEGKKREGRGREEEGKREGRGREEGGKRQGREVGREGRGREGRGSGGREEGEKRERRGR